MTGPTGEHRPISVCRLDLSAERKAIARNMSKFILLIPLTNRPFRTMTSFYYYDQNPLGFFFLVRIRAFVIQTSLALQNLNIKGKTKKIMVVAVK